MKISWKVVRLLRAMALIALLACMTNCTSEQIPEEYRGKTEKEVLTIKALKILKQAENYNPENFEEGQRKVLDLGSLSFRNTALAHLPRRVARIQSSNVNSSFEPDLTTVQVEIQELAKMTRARVKVEGDRTWETDDREPGTDRVLMAVTFSYQKDDGPISAPHTGWTMKVLD